MLSTIKPCCGFSFLLDFIKYTLFHKTLAKWFGSRLVVVVTYFPHWHTLGVIDRSQSQSLNPFYHQMPGRERSKGRLTNKFKHLLHFLIPGRSKSPLPNRPITPTLDPQASSTPVGPDPTQPLNSPSSNIYSSIVVQPAGSEDSRGKATVFQGVKTTLRLVERAADTFPPLKSTAAGLLGVIDIVEV